jgi:hypothetical protein
MEYPVKVDPVGGVGGVHEIMIFPPTVNGVAPKLTGAPPSVKFYAYISNKN